MVDPAILKKMQADWDQRARDNARYYIATEREDWTDEEFFRYGECTVAEQIRNDMANICQGKNPKQMRVLEIGCGAGRVTRALAGIFGEVHAVDVSGEMVALAQQALRDHHNTFVYQNNGMDLSVIPEQEYDFAFSTIVFQHIASLEVIENYVREVHRLLRSGALFKFDVRGETKAMPDVPGKLSFFSHLVSGFKRYTAKRQSEPEIDTWMGMPFSDDDAVAMAHRCGFEPRYRHGAGEQYFWLWYFKLPTATSG